MYRELRLFLLVCEMSNIELEKDPLSNSFTTPIPDKLLKTAEELDSQFFMNRNLHISESH